MHNISMNNIEAYCIIQLYNTYETQYCVTLRLLSMSVAFGFNDRSSAQAFI